MPPPPLPMHPPPSPPNDAMVTATATAISGVPTFFLLQLVSSPVAVKGPPLVPPSSSGNPSPCLPTMAPQQRDPLQEPRQFAAVSSACANQRGHGEAAPMRLGFKAMPCTYKSHARGQGLHGQPRRMVLASDEWRLFDIGTEEEEDGHGRRRTKHLSSSRLVSSIRRRSSSTTTKRHHRSSSDALDFIRATEDKRFMSNQGAWCSQATNGGCSTSATQTTTMSSSLSSATTVLY